MKLIIFAVLVSIFFSCKKEEALQRKSSTVTGTKIDVEIVSDTKADSIIVTDAEYKNWNSFSDNSKFTAQFNRNVPHLYKIAIYINGKPYLNDKELWLNNGNPKIKLHFSGNAVVIDTVFNSPIYYEYYSYIKKMDDFDIIKDSITRNNYLIAKIDEHFNDSFSNLVSENYLFYNRSNSNNLKVLSAKINSQSSDVKNSAMSIHKQLLQIITVKNFDLQSFTLVDRKGETIKPVMQKNKRYVLDFWFVKCRPCIADHKLIQQRLNDFKKHDIEVVGISIDLEYAVWNNYLVKHNYNWANFKQINPSKNNPTDYLGINGYPTYIIVDSKGVIAPNRYNSVKEVFKDYLDK